MPALVALTRTALTGGCVPIEHRADPTPPPHHGQGRGGNKKESFSLRVSPALHPPERPSPRRADMAGHGLGRETRERSIITSSELERHINYLFFPMCPDRAHLTRELR